MHNGILIFSMHFAGLFFLSYVFSKLKMWQSHAMMVYRWLMATRNKAENRNVKIDPKTVLFRNDVVEASKSVSMFFAFNE